MFKQRLVTILFGSKAYQVIVSAAFGIGDRDVDPVRENLPTVYEVTGGKNRIVWIGCQFKEGVILDLQQILAVRRFIPVDLRPETDAAKQKDGKTIQILKVYLRIKRERVSGFQRDIKGFVSAFYISKTGIYRFFVNNGKLVDPLFYLIKEISMVMLLVF